MRTSPASSRLRAAADLAQSALTLCAAGKFAEALAMVSPLLDAQPAANDSALAEALNVAAVCSLGLGRPEDAQVWWRQSIKVKPDFLDAYNRLGIVLKGLNRLAEAEAILQQLLAISPDHADANNNLGAVLFDLGRLPEAEAAYRQALAARPGYAQAHHNLGLVLYRLRRLHEAEAAYRQALASQPDLADAHNNLGNVLRELGRLPEADQAYRQALTLRPHYPEALNNFASVLKASNGLPQAELACRLALTMRPDYAEAHNNLGSILADMKRLPEAEACFRQALSLRADDGQTHYNLGVVLQALKRLPEAEVAYRQALLLSPHAVEAHNNLGNVLQGADRLEDAAAAYRQALAIRPDLAEAHHNLGSVLRELGCLPQAEEAYCRALAVRPDYHDAQYSLALLLLSMGKFAEGWPLHESRYVQAEFVHRKTAALLPCPQWRGEPLAGKSLLVWQEDGLGDAIQFGRYLPLLKARGVGRITLACAPALHRLLAAVDGVDAVLDHAAASAGSPQFDCWTSLLSAPLYLRTTVDAIPAALCLRPEAALLAHWRSRLAALAPGFRVGLVWKGNPKHANDAQRSIPSLDTLKPLWSVPGVSFVSLQKGQGEGEAQVARADQPLLHLGSDVTDLADSAAIIEQLDLVISVDTSAAHLAASLGKPCWVMLPRRRVDWRWMHARSDSPWYPDTVRLFRQADDDTWATTIERVRQALLIRR